MKSIKPKINFVSLDDWSAMYIDGKVVLQDHSLYYKNVLDELGITYASDDFSNDSGILNEINSGGNLPETISELNTLIKEHSDTPDRSVE